MECRECPACRGKMYSADSKAEYWQCVYCGYSGVGKINIRELKREEA